MHLFFTKQKSLHVKHKQVHKKPPCRYKQSMVVFLYVQLGLYKMEKADRMTAALARNNTGLHVGR